MNIGSEKKLIQSCIEGNISAQLELYNLFANDMYNNSLRILKNKEWAEDVMQDGFIIAFNKLKDFKFESSFKTWLSRIIINKSIDEFNKKKKIKFIDFDLNEYKNALFDEEIEEIHSIDEVLEELKNLPDNLRMAIELFYLSDYSHEEIANELNISYENSRILLHRAKCH